MTLYSLLHTFPIVVPLVFAVWSSSGEAWYIYILNFILLFISLMFISNPCAQGLIKGFAYIYVSKLNGVLKALWMNVLTAVFFLIAYFIMGFVFEKPIQYVLFFLVSIILSIIILVLDGRVQMFILSERELLRIQKKI